MFLILGILVSSYFPVISPIEYLSTFVFLLGLLISLQRIRLKYNEQYYYAIFIGVLFFIFGGFISSLTQAKYNKHHLVHIQHQQIRAVAKVIEAPKLNTKAQVKLQMLSIEENYATQKLDGKIIAYFPLTEQSAKLNAGDIVQINARINPTEKNKNPYSFNFQRFYANQEIYHQGSIIDWHLVKQSHSWYRLLINQREKLLAILAQHLPSDNEFAVGATLCLGSKQFLSDKLKNEYASTGAMHVLAVSGLHVGIVFSFIFMILSTFKTRKTYWLIAKILITIFCLWMYAFLTGGTASVLRAAVMFSFITVAVYLRRTVNTYNTLSAAAFCLLVFNPNLLFDVGFQLSFTAVTGIVYFQPKIYSWLSFDWKPVDMLWQLSSVGIAAQIATFPIGLYYFHHLPVYFIVTGIFVVPLAYLILMTGISLFIVNCLSSFLATWVGYALYFLIWTNNSLIHIVSEFPGDNIGNVFITGIGLSAIYLVLYCMDRFMRRGQAIPLLLACLMIVSSLVYVWHEEKEGFFCIYHSRGEQLIDLSYQGELLTLKSESLSTEKANFATSNVRQYHGIQSSLSESNKIRSVKNIYLLGDQKIGIINSSFSPNSKIHLDCLVLSNNAPVNITDLQKKVQFDKLIFDSSNSKWTVSAWKEECASLSIEYYAVAEEGAYYETF